MRLRPRLALFIATGFWVACGHSASTPPGPPPSPVLSVCAPFEARAAAAIAGAGACSSDADCTCRSGLLFGDCGAATTMAAATALDVILRDSNTAGCSPDGPRCAPRECTAHCAAAECVE